MKYLDTRRAKIATILSISYVIIQIIMVFITFILKVDIPWWGTFMPSLLLFIPIVLYFLTGGIAIVIYFMITWME